MAAEDFQPWTVLYKAVADFSELIAEAAKARAELEALTKDINGLSKGISDNAAKAAKAQDVLTKSIVEEGPALDSTARAAKNYNRWVLFGGRETIQQHLADLQKEEQLTTLLNRAKQRGFMTPQQDYAYRQREYTQLLLWNRAEMMGYQTPEQYLTYLQKERTAFNAMTTSWRQRDEAVASALTTMSGYADKLGAATLSPRQLSDANKGLNTFSDNLTNLPDDVSVKLIVDAVQANADIDAFQENLAQTPLDVNTFMSFDDGTALTKAESWKAFLESIPKVAVTRLVVSRPDFTGTAVKLPPLHGTVDEKVNYVQGGSLPDSQLGDINKTITLLSSESSALRNYGLSAAQAKVRSADAAAGMASVGAAASKLRAETDAGALALAAEGDAATKAAGSSGGGGFYGWATAMAAAGAAGNKWFGGGGWLGRVSLFGGASFIAGWHLAADALIEFAAVAIPAVIRAAAGLGAYMAAAFSSYSSVFQHFVAQFETTAATAMDMAPFAVNSKGKAVQQSSTTSLDFVAVKVQPDVMQQLGDVITLMKSNSSVISTLATSTGGVLDRFFAKVVYDFTHGSGAMHTLLATGERDLIAFGHVASGIGTLFMQFVKATEITHIAEDLLGLLATILKVAAGVGKLIGPWGLATAIAIHAAFVYGGLLVTALKNFGTWVLKTVGYIGTLGAAVDKNGVKTNVFQRAMTTLAKIPVYGWVAIAVAAFGLLIYKLDNVKDATQNATAALVTMVSHSSVQQLLPNLGTAISKIGTMMDGLTKQLNRVPTAMSSVAIAMGASTDPMISGLNRVLQATIPFKGSLNSLAATMQSNNSQMAKSGGVFGAFAAHIENITPDVIHFFTAFSGSTQAVRDLGVLGKQANQFGSDATAVSSHLGQLAKMFGGNLVEGMGAAQMAGVTVAQMMSTNKKVWGEALIQVNSMIMGYEQFGQKAGALGADIDAVTYAQSNQLKQMATLNSSWDTFISNVEAPRSTFISFAQSLVTFGQDAKVSGAQMTGLGHGISALPKTVSNAALTLQSDFQTTLTSANAMLDALRTSGAPASVFDGVTKNLIQVLIPLSGHSRAAHAEISALSQEAGGPASHNIGVLSAYAGKAVSPMKAMMDATNAATIATSNLGTDAKRVTNVLTGFINNGIAVAAAAMFDLSGKIKTYVYDLDHYGAADARTQTAQEALNGAITKARKIAVDAGNGIDGMSSSVDKYTQKLDNSHSASVNFINNMVSSQVNAGKAAKDLQGFTDSVLSNTTNTSQGVGARAQLLKDLKAAGYDSSTANGMLFLYTQAIQKNQTATGNAHADRQQMITDLMGAHQWSAAAKLDLAIYTNSVDENRQKTQLGRAARAQLIADLEKSGVNATTAKRLVQEYTKSLQAIPKNESTHVSVTGTGTWSVSGVSTPAGAKSGSTSNPIGEKKKAVGGYISPGAGTPGVDSVHALLMPGEYVVKADSVQKYGVGTFEALNAQKLAVGGVVGSDTGTPPQVGAWADKEDSRTVQAIESSVAGAVKAADAAAASAAANAINLAGVSNAGAVAALRSAAAKAGWTGAQWTALEHVEMAEAGFNIHAQNPGSGAYGMAQFIDGPSEYARYGGNSTTAAGQAVGMVNYIKQRYGNPEAAWAHEEADHWYAEGGPVGMAAGGKITHKHLLDAAEAAWMKAHHKSVYGAGTRKNPYYTGSSGWQWLNTHPPRAKAAKPHAPIPGSEQDLAQKYTHYFSVMQTAMAKEERAERKLNDAKWPHGKNSEKPYKLPLSTLGKRQNTVNASWGALTSDANSPDAMTAGQWKAAIGASDTMRKWTDKDWVQILRKKHPSDFESLHSKLKAGEAAEKTAYYYWNKLYGVGGIDAIKDGPPHPGPSLLAHGATGIPTPNIAAMLPLAPPPSYATGGLVGLGAGLMSGVSMPAYASPRFATGGVVLPEPARGISSGAAAAGGATKQSGPLIGSMTINNPLPQASEESITRGVQKAAFLAGRGVA